MILALLYHDIHKFNIGTNRSVVDYQIGPGLNEFQIKKDSEEIFLTKSYNAFEETSKSNYLKGGDVLNNLRVVYGRIVRVIAITCIACVSLANIYGCSNPKDASEKNFFEVIKQARPDSLIGYLPILNHDVYRQKTGVSISANDILIIEKSHTDAEKWDLQQILKDLSRAGIALKIGYLPHGEGILAYMYDDVYVISDKNKKKAGYFGIYKNEKGDLYAKIFFGKTVFDKVENWSEPTNYNGLILTKVNYLYEYRDVPDWVNELAHPLTKYKDIKTPGQLSNSIVLALQNTGWVPYEE
jgi:hypothetical protein